MRAYPAISQGAPAMSNSHHHNSHHHHFFKKKFVFGTSEDDVLNGTNRDDIIFGFSGDDQISAGNGNDTVFAGRGDDLVNGGTGNDELHGERGNDGLAGGAGNDELNGGRGRDFMVGGAGRDELTGGRGADTYVMRAGTGVDTVIDLHSNDNIDLKDFSFASGDAVIAAFQQRGRDAVLDLGNGDKLILKHTRVSELEAEQFIVSDTTTGPSSSASPYVIPVDASVSTVSLLTVGDQTSDGTGWQMVGIPDELGAYDNGDGTFTVLMNHELSVTQGVVRDHGATGAFVSKLVIDKDTLEVQSGSDLIQHVFLYDTTTDSYYDPVTDGNPLTNAYAFDRLCSADLADLGAFYNSDSGLGYNGRIFMSGEETGPPFSPGARQGVCAFRRRCRGWQQLRNPLARQDGVRKFGRQPELRRHHDDRLHRRRQPGQVYFYFGEKQATGNAVEKAGLTGGSLWGLRVAEASTIAPTPTTRAAPPIVWAATSQSDVLAGQSRRRERSLDGATLQTRTARAAGVTSNSCGRRTAPGARSIPTSSTSSPPTPSARRAGCTRRSSTTPPTQPPVERSACCSTAPRARRCWTT